ncbi:hypothetical protein UFOVP424_8 [uncultured Caudovirales phage]|uniref:Uncharacterized protein n=1 Tax=uncultured Caudovirales phage TaxID=2100421 RepID=A0A6J5M928_9CAUD|nr:hypothetical protein UFOVP424_8 [uncultured Caudovirales phage]
MTYSKGISWIDDCRIPYTKGDVDKINFDRPRVRELKPDRDWILTQAHDFTNPDFKEYNTDGRFPANLLVCDDMLNDGVISKSSVYDNNKGDTNGFHATSRDIKGKRKDVGGFKDKGTNSRYYDIDKWFNNLIDV